MALEGFNIGSIFGQTVVDIRRALPADSTSAVDIEVRFKQLEVSEEGWKIFYTKTSGNQSALSIKLAARIHASQPRISNEQMVRFLQEKLIEDKRYKGPVDGRISAEFKAAVQQAVSAEPKLKEKFGSSPEEQKLIGYLQWKLQGKTSIPVKMDGLWGSDTEAGLLYVLAGG